MQRERVSPENFLPPWTRFEHQARYEFAARFVAGQRVVDCACGAGLGSRLFAAAGARAVVAIDVAEDCVRQAATQGHAANVRFVCGSATALPVRARQADVVVSLETIEHLAEDTPYLEEVVRVLTPTGLFICSTPNRTVTNPGTTLADRPANVFHVREYTAEEFVARLGAYFGRVELYAQNPVHPARVAVARWVADTLCPRAAVRLNQILKLPRFVVRRPAYHRVRADQPHRSAEYLTAWCREPRPPTCAPC